MKYTNDSLLNCLITFTSLYHKSYGIEAMTSGLPVQEGELFFKLDNISDEFESDFSRVSQKIGLSSKLTKKNLDQFSQMVLPCILLLKNKSACILEAVDHEQKKAKIIYSELPNAPEWIDLNDLQKEYIGFAILLKSNSSYENLEDKDNISNNDRGHWFWKTLGYSSKIYRNVLIASIMINLFVLAIPMFTMNVYDRVVPNNAIETLWSLSVGVIFILVFDIILKYLRTYFLEFAGRKSDILISSKLFEKVINIKMDHRPKAVGSFASNLKEFDSIRNFLTSSTLTLLIDLPFGAIFLVVTFLIAGKIVLVPIVIIIIILIYSIILHKPLQKSVSSTFEAMADKNALLIESLANIETIKTMCTMGYAQLKWENITKEIATKSLKSRTFYNSVVTFTNFLLQLNTVIVLIVGVYLISDMQLSMGGLVATVILTARAIAPMGQVASLIVNFEEFKSAFKNIDNIMNLPSELNEQKELIHIENIKGEIEFNNVTFRYPEESKTVLKDISFKIRKGERVGIIGKSGSGKTTIEKLILNIYQPNSGFVSIDGIDVKELDPINLRKQISYVSQEQALFSGTLRSNIVLKNQAAEDKDLLNASYLGLVDQFVKSHPLGYYMPIGEQGLGLSGGQKQAVCIARAFIQDNPIVLLDEPTSFFDNTLETQFIKRLNNRLHDKTTIIISHKLNVMNMVDRLILIDDGQIVADGTKKEVLKKLKLGADNE